MRTRGELTYAALALTFGHLNTAGMPNYGEPNREPTATDPERRRAIFSGHCCS